jgi:hypothetical protein
VRTALSGQQVDSRTNTATDGKKTTETVKSVSATKDTFLNKSFFFLTKLEIASLSFLDCAARDSGVVSASTYACLKEDDPLRAR